MDGQKRNKILFFIIWIFVCRTQVIYSSNTKQVETGDACLDRFEVWITAVKDHIK